MDIRTSKPIIYALWFGKGKPDVDVFLRVFVEEMNKRSDSGIPCIIQGELRIIKPYAICCCVDSIARSPMQGITQYNGRYGCSWCHHEGEYIRNSTGTGGSRKFPFLNPLPQERTEESILKCMKLLLQSSNPADPSSAEVELPNNPSTSEIQQQVLNPPNTTPRLAFSTYITTTELAKIRHCFRHGTR